MTLLTSSAILKHKKIQKLEKQLETMNNDLNLLVTRLNDKELKEYFENTKEK